MTREVLMREPVFKFRVYPADRLTGLYALVNVWRTKAVMLKHYNSLKTELPVKVCEMFTTSTRIVYAKTRRVVPMFAEMNMHLEYTCVGAVSHEMVHVTASYLRRRRIEFGTFIGGDVEELFAHVQGWLLLQFVHRAQALKLYK